MVTKMNERARITLNYQDDKKSNSFSNINHESTADNIYDTAVAITSLQLEKTLDSVEKSLSYEIEYED